MIKPTIGRVVHFFPAVTDPLHRDDEPLAATIVRVWSNSCVNLALFDGNGHLHRRSSVLLHQEENERPDAGFAAWPAREGVTLEAKLDTTSGAAPLPPISGDAAEQQASGCRYRKKPVVIIAITFDQLVAHGIATADNMVNGMPWSFTYNGYAITHENDDCYIIPTLEGSMKMGRDDMLITGVQGEIYPCKRDIFDATYEPARPRANMSFGQAIDALKAGLRILRTGWNGKGMFVYLVPPASYPAQTGAAKAHFGEHAMVPYNAYMAVKNVDDTVSTWVPSVSDCLADDWVTVDAEAAPINLSQA